MKAKVLLKLKRFLERFKLNDNLLRFIGGGEVLPQPYSPEEEADMLEKLTEGEKEVKDKLIEHNLRLVVYIARRFENTGVDLDDLVSVGTIGLIKAVNSFNSDKNIKLATYASRCIENEILMHLRTIKKHKDTVSLYTPIGEDKEGNEIRICDIIEDPTPSITEQLLKEEQYTKLNNALKLLNKQELEIICRRYGLNNYVVETQRDIAKSLGISRSYVSRIEKKAMQKLADRFHAQDA